MVMEALLATLIVGLFSLWVWGLKQEIEELRKAGSSEPAAPEHMPHVHHEVSRQPQLKSEGADAWRQKVPTWKLD